MKRSLYSQPLERFLNQKSHEISGEIFSSDNFAVKSN